MIATEVSELRQSQEMVKYVLNPVFAPLDTISIPL